MRLGTLLLSSMVIPAATAMAADGVVTLDLAGSTTPLTFNATTGAWTGTFDDDAETIESQCFSIIHSSISDWYTWWGFTASNSADNSPRTDYLTYQYSNMATGGIALNEDGIVKTDDFGAPVVSADIPYLVGYAASFMAQHPCDIVFNDGKTYEPQGCYVNLNSYAYYNTLDGDSFSRAFTNGDNLVLEIYGVAPDETETMLTVDLASYSNGDLTLARGWKYVDLTPLGAVEEIYFKIDGTVKDSYGYLGTPAYFCLDKLSVKESVPTSITSATMARGISYDRESATVTIADGGFAAVYDAGGRMVSSGEGGALDISALPAGVYVVKSGNSRLKIAR